MHHRWRLLIFAALLVAAASCSAIAQKPEGRGVYVDRDGASHPWRISDTHTLIWDGRPYLPVGGMFNSSYIFWEQHPNPPGRDPEAQFQLTCRRLDLIRSYGVEDLYLHFCTLGVPPKIIQRVADALEDRGMKYGIEITSTPDEACFGYLLQPAKFAADARDGKASIKLDLTPEQISSDGRVDLRWVALSPDGPCAAGALTVEPDADGGLSCSVAVPAEATRVVYAPEVKLSAADPSAMFAGYDAYERRLVRWLRQMSFGPGFRFIVDPFRNEQSMSHDTLPTHYAFTAGLEDWLRGTYSTLSDLNAAWKTRPELPTWSAAARSIPVTSSALVGPGGELFRLGPGTTYFRDVGQYRTDCAERFNSQIADAIKSVHDVPVIFKHNVNYKRMFTNNRSSGGFDGIGWESYGDGASLMVHNAGVCFAEAEQSDRTMWSVVTETSPAAFETQKSEIGYVTPQRMFNAFDTFLRAGAKGVFVFGFTFDPPGGFMTTEVIRDPRNLAWMGAYKRILEAAADSIAAYKPAYAYCYPADMQFARSVGGESFAIDGHTGDGKIFPTREGSWVLPAERPDVETPLLIQTTDRAEMVRRAISDVTGALRWPTLKQFRWETLGYGFLPDAGEQARIYSNTMKMLASWPIIPLPERKTAGNEAIGYGFYYDTFDQKTTWEQMAQAPDELTGATAPRRLWCEAEDCRETSFNIPSEDGYEAFSNERALSVFCTEYVPAEHFAAQFRIPVGEPGRYELWVRERTLAKMSPCRFRAGDGPWQDIPLDTPPVDAVRLDWWSSIFAGNDLAWYKYGVASAQAGELVVTIEALPDEKKRTEKHIDALRLELVGR